MTTQTAAPLAIESMRRIAFRTGRGLGDAVLCEPLVRRLVESFPLADVTVMLPASCTGMDRLGFPGNRFTAWREPEDLDEIIADYNLVIDADPGQYFKPYHTVDAAGADMVRLFAHYRPEAEQTTAYERMAEGLAKIGPNAVLDTPTLQTTPTMAHEASAALASLNLVPGAPIIIIHPGSNAGYAYKRWMAEGFAETAVELGRRLEANIVLVGSGGESELIDTIRSGMASRYPLRVALDWSLCDLAVLLTKSALHIGNDSGIGHLAAALGKPVVTVAGPTYPHFWGPMTDRALVVSPGGCCYKPETCGVFCLRSIPPSEVIGAAEALLHASMNDDTASALDPIRLAPDLEIEFTGDDSMILRNPLCDIQLRIDRGKDPLLDFLRTVESSGSTRVVQSAVTEADVLLEQCLRYSIVLHGSKKEKDKSICLLNMKTTPKPT